MERERVSPAGEGRVVLFCFVLFLGDDLEGCNDMYKRTILSMYTVHRLLGSVC